MLRGYRLLIIVLGLILCGAQPPKEEILSQPSVSQAEGAKGAYAAHPEYNDDPCYRAKSYNAADLCVQWRATAAAEKAAHEARRATNWSILATILSAIGLFAIVWSLRQTEHSLKAAQKANSISLDSAERQVRAYIGVKNAGYHLAKQGARKHHYSLVLCNSGQSPAYDIKMHIRCFVDDAKYIPYLFVSDEIEKQTGTLAGPGGEFGYFYMPFHTIGSEKADIKSGKKSIFLVASLLYSDAFRNRYRIDLIYRSSWKEKPVVLFPVWMSEIQIHKGTANDDSRNRGK